MRPKHVKLPIWRVRATALGLGFGLGLWGFIGSCWWDLVVMGRLSCLDAKPDFSSIYTGAKLMASGASSLYDLKSQLAVQRPLYLGQGDWVLPFMYPPFFAWMLTPLAWLSYPTAYFVMTVVNLVLLVGGLMLLVHRLGLCADQSRCLYLSVLCNFGVSYCLLEGQTSILVFFLLVLFVTANLDEQDIAGGLWAALLSLKPQLLLMPVVVLIGQRRWRAVLVFAVSISMLGLFSFILVGEPGAKAFFKLLGQAASGDDALRINPERMHNLRALVYFTLPFAWNEYVWWIGTLALLALLIHFSRNRPTSRRQRLVLWLKIFAATMLITPHFHDHDLTLMIIPTAVILKLTPSPVPASVLLLLLLVGLLPLLRRTIGISLVPVMPLLFLLALWIPIEKLLPDPLQRNKGPEAPPNKDR